ncbi:MAG: hypothetical protein ACP5RJ_07795 [Conexivisphaera sp.]
MNAYQEEEEEEFEAVNVGRVVNINGRDFESKLENLITEVLEKDYGVIDGRRGEHASIPAGGLIIENDDGTWYYYSTEFEIFDRLGWRVLMAGRAAGKMIWLGDGNFEIEDITITLERE